jgi:glycosyltransferase involved in cell wall biosynthesis
MNGRGGLVARKSVLIIGFGIIENHGELIRTKSTIASYLNSWNQTYDVTWATERRRGQPLFSGEVDSSIRVVYLNRNILRNFMLLNFLTRSQEHARFDYIVAAYPGLLLVAPWLLHTKPPKAQLVYIGNDFRSAADLKTFSRRFVHCLRVNWRWFWIKLTLKRTSAIIARGKYIGSIFSSFGLPVHQTVPLTQISCATQKPEGSLCLPERYVLFIGTVSVEKGFDLLLEGYTKALMSQANVPDLVVVGVGPLFRAGHLFHGKVHFLGYIDGAEALSTIYERAEKILVPSRPWGEGVPRVIEEALAHGLSVVSTALETVKAEFSSAIDYFPSIPPTPDEIATSITAASRHPDPSFKKRPIGGAEAARQHMEIIQGLAPSA